MPTFDFECIHCGHRFSELVPYARREEVVCPKCGQEKPKVLISGFFVGRSTPKFECGSGSCGFSGAGGGGCPGGACCPGAR